MTPDKEQLTLTLSGPEFIGRLEGLAAVGLAEQVDLHFARTVCRRFGAEGDADLFLAALLASQVVNRHRQVCLAFELLPETLAQWLADGIWPTDDGEIRRALKGLEWPPAWEERLAAHPAVAGPDTAGRGECLLVLEERRLYLQRYWDYEQQLAGMIVDRLKRNTFEGAGQLPPLPVLAPRFAGRRSPVGEYDFQAAALVAGLRGRFTVISGGPGCGKTSVAAAICAGWLTARPGAGIMLCAPTGLAQARLAQAIRDEAPGLGCDEAVREKLLGLPAATIHRLLGYRPGYGFGYHSGRRLAVDLLIVDEASMVPLWILSSLFEALPDEGAVILLGDRNQLASVEAGAVLGDICSLTAATPLSADFRADYDSLMAGKEGLSKTPSPVSGPSAVVSARPVCLADCVVELEKSWRFAPDGGIFRLQKAILAAAEDGGEALRAVLADDPSGEVRIRTVPATGGGFADFLVRELGGLRIEYGGETVALADYARHTDPGTAFALFNSFRLLSPLRRGRFGVENLNRLAPFALGLAADRKYYPGRPLMITCNDPGLGLFNGDIGLVRADARGRLRAWFAAPGGAFESFSPVRLPAHESAYAVTVHKAQGSGFAHVVLVWPERDSPLLTREMLYTAVTRAARRIEIWLPEGVSLEALAAAAARRVERPSGLLVRLARYPEMEE